MYAIVDLETTGGHAETDRIIEIAIFIHDGQKIIDEFSSLVNPGVLIPPFIARLTNISDDMVARAPGFNEIAEQVAALLQDKIFVAHNVMFDYSFLMHSLSREGYHMEHKLLCTCKSSRSLLPGHPSYSLGRLCRSLSINLTGAHRASADARATTAILEKLIDKTNGVLEPFYFTKEKRENKSKIPDEMVENLPRSAGILYFLDNTGNVIYLAKSRNIRKMAWTIIGKFRNRRFSAVAALATAVEHKVTGSYLLASLVETEENRTIQPKFNRKITVAESRVSIYEKLHSTGYLYLETGLFDPAMQPVVTFAGFKEAKSILLELIQEFQLQLTSDLDKIPEKLFTEDTDTYNSRVVAATSKLKGLRKNFLVTDRGPEPDQLSVVVIRNGTYAGYLFTDRNRSFHNVEEILEELKPSDDHPMAFKSIVRSVSMGNYREIIHF